MLVGGDTPLDRAFVRSLKGTGNVYSTRAGPFRELSSTYFAVVGDFLVSLKQPRKAMSLIDRLFGNPNPKTFEQADLRDLVDTRHIVKVRIENNSLKAGQLRGKFRRFLG